MYGTGATAVAKRNIWKRGRFILGFAGSCFFSGSPPLESLHVEFLGVGGEVSRQLARWVLDLGVKVHRRGVWLAVELRSVP